MLSFHETWRCDSFSGRQVIFIMTQDQLRLLSYISLGCLSLSIFQLPTLLWLVLAGYFTYRYLKVLARKYISRGLIELCPERLKHQLLNRSIFDFICSIWFRDSFIFLKKFFKILVKPLVQPIEPENAIEALNDFDQDTKQLYLQKGVVRVMPQFCQKVILGSERAQQQKNRCEENQRISVKLVEEGSSQRITRDRSNDQDQKRMVRVSSQSNLNNCSKIIKNDQWSGDNSQRGIVQIKRKSQDYPLIKMKKPKSKGLIHTIQNSLSMLKKIIEMQNIGGNIQKINSKTLIKILTVFWLSLLLQVKFNQKARKSVIRMLYVMGSMVTVMGIVGTTAILTYKHWNKRRRNSEISQLEQ